MAISVQDMVLKEICDRWKKYIRRPDVGLKITDLRILRRNPLELLRSYKLPQKKVILGAWLVDGEGRPREVKGRKARKEAMAACGPVSYFTIKVEKEGIGESQSAWGEDREEFTFWLQDGKLHTGGIQFLR